MARFPETKHTLIRRLAEQNQEADWQLFVEDYWNPLCRFSARWGHLQFSDAEEVASLTLLAIFEGKLVERWIETPHSKLRTLICSVARNVLSNRARIQSGRDRILQENRDLLLEMGAIRSDDSSGTEAQDAQFYAAWVEELLQSGLKSLQHEYLTTGRADYFRVLYGRICESMSNPEIAECLKLKVADVENYFKRAKSQLQSLLHQALINQVSRYCPPGELEEEIEREWNRLGEFLKTSGGLEKAMRDSYDFSVEIKRRGADSKTTLLRQISERD